jgi:hypothetical protein
MKTKFYVGCKTVKREVFKAAETPTPSSHGHLYNAVIGPFRTKRGATFMAERGVNNPHCRCVADAERIAKRQTVV